MTRLPISCLGRPSLSQSNRRPSTSEPSWTPSPPPPHRLVSVPGLCVHACVCLLGMCVCVCFLCVGELLCRERGGSMSERDREEQKRVRACP